MVADKLLVPMRRSRIFGRDMLRLVLYLYVTLPRCGLFLSGFIFLRSQLQLNLPLQRRNLRFQLLQLVLLFPYAADGLLQNRNIPLISYILRLVLLD